MKILKDFLKYDLRSRNGLKIVPIRAVQIFWPPWHFRKYSGSKSSSIWNSKQNTEVLRIIIDVSYKVADKLDFTSNTNCEFYIFLPRFLFTFFFLLRQLLYYCGRWNWKDNGYFYSLFPWFNKKGAATLRIFLLKKCLAISLVWNDISF